MSNLVLVRHGQSVWNKERRFTGWADIGLTEKGISEAEMAGRLIKELNVEFHKFFTSKLKRAINSLEIILKVLNKNNSEIIKTTSLNERHYGGLTSLNKDETIKKYGDKQVNIWRRSFNVPPPSMDSGHPFKNKIKANLASESLKDTFDRVVPYYIQNIEPLITSKKNILIVFHGNSCRSLLKKIFNISDKKIVELEVPTGNPFLIRFKENLKVLDYKYLDEKRAKKVFINS